MSREKELIDGYYPCDANFFRKDLLFVDQLAVEQYSCPNLEICSAQAKRTYCALRFGAYVARKVIAGEELEKELNDIARVSPKNAPYWNSVNGREFVQLTSSGQIIKAVEGFARIVLLQDPFESVLKSCEKCEEGVVLEKEVLLSGRDGVSAFSGSGRTKSEVRSYCSDCGIEPPDRDTFDENVDVF